MGEIERGKRGETETEREREEEKERVRKGERATDRVRLYDTT